MSSPGSPQVVVCEGALATEARLLADLWHELEASPATLPPEGALLVVVPSRSLRLHLLARIAARRKALAGLACRTLHGLAAEVLQRCGHPLPAGDAAFPLLVRRLAGEEELLRRHLRGLDDGFGMAVGTVRDLLDAGFDPAHAEALDEVLAEEGPAVASRLAVERARALVRVTAAVAEALEWPAGGRTSTLLARAADLLRQDPRRALAVRRVFVHGFADATGVASDLLDALLGAFGGSLYLDRPPDPARRDAADPGAAFSHRFAARMTARATPSDGAEGAREPVVRLFRALGVEAEVREIVRRLLPLLAGGAVAERFAVVLRDPGPYVAPLRRQFTRLGIPFSGVAMAGPLDPSGRRLAAFLDVLGRGGEVSVDRWLDARGRAVAEVAEQDLRLGLAVLGGGRLRDLERLDAEPHLRRGDLPLPLREGWRPGGEEDEEERQAGRPRRRLPGAVVRAALAAARRTLARLDALDGAAPPACPPDGVVELAVKELGWSPTAPETEILRAAAAAVLEGLPAGLVPTRGELASTLARQLDGAGAVSFGGAGGGVQILDALEARGRTFDHLFLPGLNRGLFPRPVREDPLLPDALRALLARAGHGVLPDLREKRLGFDEERYLFAQLLSSSPEATLSFLVSDDDQRELAPSPLLERLRWSDRDNRPDWTRVPLAGHYLADDASEEVLTADEAVVRGAVRGAPRRSLLDLLAGALAEGQILLEGPPHLAQRLASVRLAILDEMDPDLRTERGRLTRRSLGPYFGFLGRPGAGDPRNTPRIYVTRLEDLARCPWQTFVRKVLRLEPLPDPLGALPALTGAPVGDLVHRLLARRVREGLEAASARTDWAPGDGSPVHWWEPGQLEPALAEEAAAVARVHGAALPGYAALLAEVARPYLEVARRLAWSPTPRVVAAERQGELPAPGGDRLAPRSVAFRADRVERQGSSVLLTDYKTGRPLLPQKQPGARRKRLLEQVRSGQVLQAVAYARASGGTGRYLYLTWTPELADEARSVRVEAGDAEMMAAFDSALHALLAAWREGVLFPRLIEPDRDRTWRACPRCPVAEACLRGDSGSRARLRAWAAASRPSADGQRPLLGPAEEALAALWNLPAPAGEEEWG